MTLLGKRVAVSIPDTVLEEKGGLREKTAKLGSIARACAIYGVDKIEVFRDPRGRGEAGLVSNVLEYLETPQYLRKRLFPIDESLRFAGVLPPLRIPSHKLRIRAEDLKVGDFREGVAESDGTVDVGLDSRPKLEGHARGGERVTVVVTSVRPLTARRVGKEEPPEYWGFTVESCSLEEVFDPRTGLRVATSRLGDSLGGQVPRLRSRLGSVESVKLIYGSPARGLFDMAGDLRARVDFVVNLFGEQHAETVRTEEAVFAGLGLLDMILSEKA